MTREELQAKLPGYAEGDLMTLGLLFDVLEAQGILVKAPVKPCPVCHLSSPWPDDWLWSQHHHGYVCKGCAGESPPA